MVIKRVLQQLKNFYHYLQSLVWQAVNGWPTKGMRVYGITGTNGKTTTAIVLASILREAHGADKVGLLSTEVFCPCTSDKDLGAYFLIQTAIQKSKRR